jgi:CHAD domain-containing protein
MTPELRGFELEAGTAETAGPAAVLDALGQHFGVAEHNAPGSGTRQRTWLDTFDWRLNRAGLVLEYEHTRHGGRLLLSRDNRPQAEQPVERWQPRKPRLAEDLPEGPVRDRIAKLARPRALLPMATAVGTLTVKRLLNADGKTVARLIVDRESVTRGDRTIELPVHMAISEVRGYPGQARKATRLLAAAPGVAAARYGAFLAALQAIGRRPGDYSNGVTAGITAQMPGSVAAAALMLGLLDTLEQNVDGTLRDIDTEFLHDLRVSVRRTRTALKLGAALLPDGMAERYQPEFKWLGDLTTPMRDLDVHLLGFDAGAAELTSADPADLAPFHDYLTQRRVIERRRLARALRSARFTALTAAWRTALTGLTPPRRSPDAAHAAAKIIGRAHRRVLILGGAISADSPPEKLHDLRKRCKELRYALEFFASLHDQPAHRRAVRELKGLQDCLGTYQDCQVQQQEIRAIAADLLADGGVPATALLAMGDLASHVGQRERHARSEFSSRFAAFASSQAQARFEVLTASAHS